MLWCVCVPLKIKQSILGGGEEDMKNQNTGIPQPSLHLDNDHQYLLTTYHQEKWHGGFCYNVGFVIKGFLGKL